MSYIASQVNVLVHSSEGANLWSELMSIVLVQVSVSSYFRCIDNYLTFSRHLPLGHTLDFDHHTSYREEDGLGHDRATSTRRS